MALDAQTQAFLQKLQASGDMKSVGEPNEIMSVEETRQHARTMYAATAGSRMDVHRREEMTVPGPGGDIPVRLYWPDEAKEGKALPAIAHAHGGGYVAGDLDCYENWARAVCVKSGMVICMVDYRLAPENKFPAGLEDMYAVMKWLQDNAADLGVDPNKLAISGDSAGGNIAAGVVIKARDDESLNIAGQFFESANFTIKEGYSSPSRMYLGDLGFAASNVQIEWVTNLYINSPEERNSPLTSMLQEVEDLSGLPPAIIITAAYDTLRSEAEEYAERLRDAGVPVSFKCFDGTIHGFYAWRGDLDVADEGNDYLAQEAKKYLS